NVPSASANPTKSSTPRTSRNYKTCSNTRTSFITTPIRHGRPRSLTISNCTIFVNARSRSPNAARRRRSLSRLRLRSLVRDPPESPLATNPAHTRRALFSERALVSKQENIRPATAGKLSLRFNHLLHAFRRRRFNQDTEVRDAEFRHMLLLPA